MPTVESVLAMNAGSSSIKFALYSVGSSLHRTLRGQLGRSGSGDAALSWQAESYEREEARMRSDEPALVLEWLEARREFQSVVAVGHRLVHGLGRREPIRVTPDIVQELRTATPFAPEHLPREILLIEALLDRHPDLPQVACFDTAFHRDLPEVASMLPIPRRYHAKGVQRYGFHGLSYAFLLEELARVAGADAARGRIIFAHLGNGASLSAVRAGTCVDTSMGFTPASGLVMSTRPGDLDPGVMSYLAGTEGMSPQRFDAMVNYESGLLGISETSSDMRNLLQREADDERAAQAVALFCYQAKKWVGAFAAVLGGLDTLVFSGGIGEHSAPIRARICEGLGFLGIELDHARNAAHGRAISADGSRVTVRVIATDEELMIARSVCRTLGLDAQYGR